MQPKSSVGIDCNFTSYIQRLWIKPRKKVKSDLYGKKNFLAVIYCIIARYTVTDYRSHLLDIKKFMLNKQIQLHIYIYIFVYLYTYIYASYFSRCHLLVFFKICFLIKKKWRKQNVQWSKYLAATVVKQSKKKKKEKSENIWTVSSLFFS